MVPAVRRIRVIFASEVIAVILATLMVLAAFGCSPQGDETIPTKRATPTRPAADPSTTAPATAAPMGTAGTYQVGERQKAFDEPAHTGPTGEYLDQRTLETAIYYPLAQSSASPQPASGRFPLLLFGPGFMNCSDTYEHLLETWVSAGYVVAAVNFPRTNCNLGTAAYRPDLVNQPGDMSYVLSKLLSLSAQPGNVLSGLLNPNQIAAAGHSDGGDTVAALAANTCCRDHRLKAVAVLSGAEWPAMPGKYFSHGAPPMLFTQGSADTINPPSASLTLYQADGDGDRYYFDLFGASHSTPYAGTNRTEHLAARVTLAFFDRYVLGQTGALATMMQDGNVSGIAALVSGDQLPPRTG